MMMEPTSGGVLTPPWRGAVPVAALLLILACGDPAGPEGCNEGAALRLEGGNCLVFRDNGRLDGRRATIERVVRETTAAVRRLVPLTDTEIVVVTGRAGAIPEIGIGGRAHTERIRLTFDPDSPVLDEALTTELFPLLAHEMHHIVRHRAVGFSSNLFQQFINEGLADHFSMEAAGGEPAIWATAVAGAELERWIDRAEEVWLSPDYDLDAWLFGTTAEIPRWTGYSIGFEVVRRYLEANPGSRASALFDEPARSFLP